MTCGSYADDFRILVSPRGVPENLRRLIHADGRWRVPQSAALQPHHGYLRWHREQCYKG